MKADLYKAHPLEIRLSASNSKVAKIHKIEVNSNLLSSVIKASESTKWAKAYNSQVWQWYA